MGSPALLLRLRLPRARDPHPPCYVRRDLDCALLLSIVQRGLQLVVARFPQFGRRWAVPHRVLVRLLLHAARDGRLRPRPPLLHLHDARISALLLVTGTVGFLSAWAFVHVIYGAIKVD